MLRAYAEWTERARAFPKRGAWSRSRTARSASSSRRRCSSGRSSAVASYRARRRSRRSLRATSSCPSRPTARPPRRSRSGSRTTRYAGIPTTAVHEAYPGHHWHLVMAKSSEPGPARVRDAVLQRRLGALRRAADARAGLLHRPLQELTSTEATLFRAARIVVDTSLHIGEMTFDEAISFMARRRACPSRPRAPRSAATARGRPRRPPT